MEREKKMRLDLERQKMDLEEKLQMAQKQAKISYQRQVRFINHKQTTKQMLCVFEYIELKLLNNHYQVSLY